MMELKGWPIAYIVLSIPLLGVYSMGLSGWFFEYPLALMVAIFAVLAVPLVMLIVRYPQAPRWNIGLVWTCATMMLLRSISVFLEDPDGMTSAEFWGIVRPLAVINGTALAWAISWTMYFRNAARYRNTV